MTTTTHKPLSRPRRRWIKWLLGLSLVPVLAVLALPWVLSSGPGRTWLLARGNRAMAPGGLAMTRLDFSWFGPTRMTDFTLIDPQGEQVVRSSRATWDRNLREILFDGLNLGTLRLEGATVDTRREADGSINLYETLRPVLGRDDRTALRIEVADGEFRLQGAGIEKAVVSEHMDLVFQLHPRPSPLEWKLALTNREAGAAESSVVVEGHVDQWAAKEGREGDLNIAIAAKAWPIDLDIAAVSGTLKGKLDGRINVKRDGGRWRSDGDATLGQLDVTASSFAGDHFLMDSLRGQWDLATSAGRLTIRSLNVTSSALTLNADRALSRDTKGIGGDLKVAGRIDLAVIAGQLPHALRLREGVVLEHGIAELSITSAIGDSGPTIDLSARVSDLQAKDRDRPFTLRAPATLSVRLRKPADTIEVESFHAETPYFQGGAKGDLAHGLTFTGHYDLNKFQGQLREFIEMGDLELAGHGDLRGDYRAKAGEFFGKVYADLQEFGATGLGAGTLSRESSTLTVKVDGATDGAGLPTSWSTLRSRIKSGEITADLEGDSATSQATLIVRVPVKLKERTAQGLGSIVARWEEQGIDLGRVELSLIPEARLEFNPVAPLGIAAKGRFDSRNRELVLTPLEPANAEAAVRLSSEGLRVSGIGSAVLKADFGFDGNLAALRPWVHSAPESLAGGWSVKGSLQPVNDGHIMAARIDLKDVSWGKNDEADSAGESLWLAINAHLPTKREQVNINELSLKSRFLAIQGSGSVVEPRGNTRATFRGTLAPQWDAINSWLGSHIEPGAIVKGRPQAFQIATNLGPDWKNTLDGAVGVSIDSADLYGMVLGPTALMVRAKEGRFLIDPIDTSLNGGRLHLEPELRLAKETGETSAILVHEGTSIRDAEINDTVSKRVLAFVAPVLDSATRVNGKVSAEIDEGVFPLGAGTRGLKLEGDLIFQDVQFLPGPLFNELLAVTGRSDRPLLRLNDPVALTIADRRVYQSGLKIPIGKLGNIEIEGWVDFDQNMNLVTSVPILPNVLAERPLLGGLAGDARIKIPVQGTLKAPEINKEAFDIGMKDLGKTMLDRTVGTGLSDLIRSMGERAKAAPPAPRLTPAERRERRLDKKRDRQAKRGLIP